MVLDIGYNTVEVIIAKDGTPVRAECGMLDHAGISRICEDLRRYLQETASIDLTEQEARHALESKYCSVYGQPYNLKTQIAKLSENYATWLFHHLQDRWGKRMQRAHVFIVAGGGAHLIKPHLPDVYFRQIYIPPEPEYTNARGFVKGLMLTLAGQN